MIAPRPLPPYWPAYPEPERSRLEQEYRALEAAWQREANLALCLHAIPPLCAVLAVVAAAILLPPIIIDAIKVLGQ